MKKMTLSILALILLFGLSANLWAVAPNMKRVPGKRIYDTKFLDINKWHLPFYNNGEMAVDLTQLNFPGGYWPAPKRNFHIFGGGLWVGAISATNETLVSIGYNPNSGGTEFYPTTSAHVGEGTGNSADRVYKYGTNDWPPSTARYGTDPNLVPQQNFSLQDLWMAFSDAAPAQHTAPGKPLGLDVYLTVYAWNYPANEDIFFMTYKVKNNTRDAFGTPSDLHNVIFGVNFDIDIGDALDDMVGMMRERVFNEGRDTVRNVGYVGDNNNAEIPSDRWESGQPGTVCVKFLQSPKRPDGTPLGMTAYKKFTLDIDPVTDRDQYQTMAGIDYRTGIYNAYDSIDEAPDDKRIIQCSGPFDLMADSVQSIIVGVACAYYGGPDVLWADRTEADLLGMAQVSITAQFIFDRGWLLPGPPESPNVTLIPMDNKVRVVWDNKSEITPDRYYEVAHDPTSSGWDPAYKAYDFEGYKIWKSTNGSDWSLLRQCDLADGDTFTDTTQADSIRTHATDSGIFYSLVDDSVINGYTYYYAVSAYDHNWTTVFDSLHNPVDSVRMPSLEGGKRSIAVTPRWEATNYFAPQAFAVKTVGDTVNPALRCSARVVVPFDVTPGDTYELRFLGPEYIAADNVHWSWVARDLRNDSLVIDTTGMNYKILGLSSATQVNNDLPMFAGITTNLKIQQGLPDSSFSGFQDMSGHYPVDSLRPGNVSASGYWAFRGSDLRLVWHRSSTRVTVDVFDVSNGGLPVPFTHFGTTANPRPESANGYCFVNNAFRNGSDSLRATDFYFYCCGVYLALNKGQSGAPRAIGTLLDLIQEGDVWNITGYKGSRTSPVYNVFHIYSSAESLSTAHDAHLLRARVVPNPYVVFDQWEVNQYNRRLAFTRLPARCDIRIFTQSGDLVKTINHTDTRVPVAGQPYPQRGELGGTEFWDLLNDNQQLIATGIYIFHVKSDVGEQVGKFSIIR